MLSQVWRALRYRPTRTAAALLQAALGALVVTLALALAFAQGRAASVSPDLTLFTAGATNKGGSQYVSVFVPTDLPKMQALAPDVQQLELLGGNVFEYVEVGQSRYRLSGNLATGPNYAALTGLKLLYGSYFNSKDAQSKVAVISVNTAQALYGRDDAVGKTLKLELYLPGQPPTLYRVIGVSEAARPGGQGIASPMFVPRDGDGPTEASQLIMLARPGRLNEAKAQLLSAAQQFYRDNADLTILRADGASGFFFSSVDDRDSQSANPVNVPLLRSYYAIAALTLIVASLGSLSAMLVRVQELTRELGLRRAIGATRGQITLNLLLESGLTTLAGSLAGVGLALLLAPALNTLLSPLLSDAPLLISPLLALTVLGLFVALSLLFGLVPALASTRMRPTEALRVQG